MAAAAERARRGREARPPGPGPTAWLDVFGRLEESHERPGDTPRQGARRARPGRDGRRARAASEAKGELPRKPLPALTATRLGKGIVVRVGLTEWAERVGQDREVAQITRNIVDVLRRVTPRVRSAGR